MLIRFNLIKQTINNQIFSFKKKQRNQIRDDIKQKHIANLYPKKKIIKLTTEMYKKTNGIPNSRTKPELPEKKRNKNTQKTKIKIF